MGGLVARSAVLQAEEQAMPWVSTVARLVCLGTPHTGAPLERAVVGAAGVIGKFPTMAPLVRVLALRSDGIKDLAAGSLLAETAARPTARMLPPGVRQLFIAATVSRSEGSLLARTVGDLLVAPSSAADRGQDADLVWLGGLHHFDLLSHDAVYDVLLQWLRTDPKRSPGGGVSEGTPTGQTAKVGRIVRRVRIK